MSVPVVTVGTAADVDGLHRLASAGGAGLTNLPPDRRLLAARLDAGEAAVASSEVREGGAAVILITRLDGAVVGTGCIIARVGVPWPFYSYRITRLAKHSPALGRTVAQRLLNLANDFDGETEVGGLFVDPAIRGQAIGQLTARARYLFIAHHRAWFRERVIAELRGWQDAESRSPFWEALGRNFYQMDFADADRLGAAKGNQFISDLGPRHPIYCSLLPEAARRAIGKPHDDGRRAHAMLLAEGFRDDGYVDIFDGGPTLVADIDRLRAVDGSRTVQFAAVAEGGTRGLVCTGFGADFRAAFAQLRAVEGGVMLDTATAAALDVSAGDHVRYLETGESQ